MQEDVGQDLEPQLTAAIIGAAIDVHRELGPGLLESCYESCLAFELIHRGMQVQRQVPLPVIYKGRNIECGYRIDLIVEQKVILEIKAIESLAKVHEAQLITYLRLSGIRIGLILNFNELILKDGIKRRVV